MEILGSFQGPCDVKEGVHHCSFSVFSTGFSLSSRQCSSSIQRSPSTGSRTDRVQHIQGSCSAAPHSSLRRVSIHPCSCPVVISPCSVSPFLFSPVQWQVLSLFSESVKQCMPASPHGTTHSPTFSTCWINQQACFETCAFAWKHGKFGHTLQCHWVRLCLLWTGRSYT